MLLDYCDVKRLWNTLFNANVLVCGQEKKTMVCLVSVLRHRNSHTKNQKLLGAAPPNHFCSRSVCGCTKSDHHVRLTDGSTDGILEIILLSKKQTQRINNSNAGYDGSSAHNSAEFL